MPLVALVGKEYGSGLVARLGRQGHAAARHPRRDRRELRAHPPLQPRRAWACCRCEYVDGQTAASLGLDGRERFTIHGIAGGVEPHQRLTVEATADDGRATRFEVLARVDSPADAEYLRHGGILPLVLRRMIAAA